MVPVSRARRHVGVTALLLLCFSLIPLLPGQPAAAQTIVAEKIDNDQGDYADGEFQRTSIGPDDFSSITPAAGELADEAGIVQLAPAGILNTWEQMPQALPVALTQAGVATLGERLYVIGGLLQGGTPTNAAYWATVEPTTGSLIDSGSGPWANDPMPNTVLIPDTQSQGIYPGCATPAAARSRVGVASVPTGPNTGYLYVVGGVIGNAGCQNYSTPVVQRGTVAANGDIAWTTLTAAPVPSPKAPSDNGTQDTRTLGVDGAATVIAHTRQNNVDRYFLYVIGGHSQYVNGTADVFQSPGAPIERVLRTVYYTEIDIATGNLKNPAGEAGSVWKRDADIDLVVTPALNEGLWDATATASELTIGNQVDAAIFLAGGSLDRGLAATKFNSYVYRADVGTNGALTWAPGTATVGPDQVGLEPRRGMASLTYNSKLYLLGGRTTNDSNTGKVSVPTAFYDDNQDLIKIDGSNFIIGTAEPVLGSNANEGRYNLSTALVRAEPPPGTIVGTLNSAWAYAIGGTNNSNQATTTIYRGKIGGDEATNVRRAPDGWYYSSVFKTSFVVGSGSATTNKLARVVAIHWAADINRLFNSSADIEIEFRKTITGSGECRADGSDFSPTEPSDAWRGPIDGFAGNPLHSKPAVSGALYNVANMQDIFPDEQINASCIQYRAHLFQNATGGAISDRASSPKLISVYIEKVIAGNADLNIPEGGFDIKTTNNRLSALTMTIQNLSIEDPDQTIAVNDALAGSGLPLEGNFFVDLCIARSDLDQPAPTLTLPDPATNFDVVNGTTCPYYAQVHTSEMGKGQTLDLTVATMPALYGGGARWYSNATGQPVPDITVAFSQTGNYAVGLVLDSLAGIPEGTLGETNNKSVVDSFVIEGSPLNLRYLPLVMR